MKEIEFSKNDVRRGFKIPKTIDRRLYEEIGIHLGDGSLGIYKSNGKLNTCIPSQETMKMKVILKNT